MVVPVTILVLLSACARHMSSAEIRANERFACANLGIDPGSEAFGQCVANLDQTITDDIMIHAR
jgi:hypothetical protein